MIPPLGVSPSALLAKKYQHCSAEAKHLLLLHLLKDLFFSGSFWLRPYQLYGACQGTVLPRNSLPSPMKPREWSLYLHLHFQSQTLAEPDA